MSWKTVSGKLTRFFGFADEAARDRFLAKVVSISDEHDHPLKSSPLGKRAVVVTCNSESCTTKDHYIGAKVDAAARSIWGSKGSNSMSVTTKVAEHEKLANIGKLLGFGKNLATKGMDIVGGAHGLPGRISDAVIPKAVGTQMAKVPIPGMRRFGSQARAQEFKPFLPKPGSEVYNTPGFSAGEYGQLMAGEARAASKAHPNPAKLEEGLTRLENQTQGTFNLGGMGELRSTLKNMEAQGLQGTPAYQSLQQKLRSVNLNRAGLVAGAPLAYGAYDSTFNPNSEPAKASPFSGIVEYPASFMDNMGAHNMAKMMRDNPGVTTGIGSAALMAMLYNMMGPR